MAATMTDVSRAASGVITTNDRGGRGAGPAPVRRPRHSRLTRTRVGSRRSSVATSSPTRVALAARPGRDGTTTVFRSRDHPQQPRDGAHVLRAGHRLGLPRRTPPGPGVRRGPAQGRTSRLPKFLDEPDRGQVHGCPGHRTRTDGVDSWWSCWLARACALVSLAALRDDAMYRLGDTYWLRIPIGETPQRSNRPPASDARQTHQRLPGLARTDPPPGCSSSATTTFSSTGAPSTATSWPQADTPGSTTCTLTPLAPHAGDAMHQPGHVARGHRRPPRASLTPHDPRLRPHLRHHRRRADARTRHEPLRPTPSPPPSSGGERPTAVPTPSPPRQRPLHQTPRARLPVPDHLRRLRLLPDRPRVRHHPAPPTRRRRQPTPTWLAPRSTTSSSTSSTTALPTDAPLDNQPRAVLP